MPAPRSSEATVTGIVCALNLAPIPKANHVLTCWKHPAGEKPGTGSYKGRKMQYGELWDSKVDLPARTYRGGHRAAVGIPTETHLLSENEHASFLVKTYFLSTRIKRTPNFLLSTNLSKSRNLKGRWGTNFKKAMLESSLWFWKRVKKAPAQ